MGAAWGLPGGIFPLVLRNNSVAPSDALDTANAPDLTKLTSNAQTLHAKQIKKGLKPALQKANRREAGRWSAQLIERLTVASFPSFGGQQR
jgi:hypothetical protein